MPLTHVELDIESTIKVLIIENAHNVKSENIVDNGLGINDYLWNTWEIPGTALGTWI